MRNLISNSFTSSIKNLYLKIIGMEELVWVSSMAWIFWFFDKVIPSGRRETITIIFILFWGIGLIYAIINLPKRKKKYVKALRKASIRLFSIPGSTLFLFLFLNSFLKISKTINQEFLAQVKSLEEAYSTTLFSVFITFVFVFAVIHFFIILKKIRTGQITERGSLWKEMILTILIVALFSLFIFEKIDIPFFKIVIVFTLRWFFGLSVIFLHLNYLIWEINKLLKGR